MAAHMEGTVLVVRDRTAIRERALALVLFLAFAGIAVMLASSPPAEAPGWALGLFGIVGPIGASIAVWWTCVRAATVETRVDPNAAEVVIHRRTLIRQVLGKLAFDDIAAVDLERRGSGEDEMHDVVLTLRNSRRVEVDKGTSPTGIAAVRNTLARTIGM